MEQDYLSKKMTDGMKGYLCLCIVLHHIDLFSGMFQNTYFGHFVNRLGGWGVALFFFISGYGLFKSYEKAGTDYIKSFPKKRLLTFYLSYYFFVVVYGIMNFWVLTAKLVVESLFFGGTIVSFGWFFQYIGLYYILFYVCFRFLPKRKTELYVAALLIGSVVCMLFDYRYLCVFPFLAGILAATQKKNLDRCLKRAGAVLLAGSLVTIFAVYFLYIYVFIFARLTLNPYLWDACQVLGDLAVILFAVSVCYFTRNYPIISNPVSNWLGRYSLGIYAVQGIVLYVFYFLVGIAPLYLLVCMAGTVLLAFVWHKTVYKWIQTI